MSIDLKTIKHISKLSRISVDEKKAEKLAGDLNSIFDFIEKLNELNTYITEDYANALNKAKKFDEKPNLDLKLPGIPMAVKDLFCTRDLRTTAGSKILNNFVPTYESTVTQNIWNEGAILMGKLNCDEFAMGSSNDCLLYTSPSPRDLSTSRMPSSA